MTAARTNARLSTSLLAAMSFVIFLHGVGGIAAFAVRAAGLLLVIVRLAGLSNRLNGRTRSIVGVYVASLGVPLLWSTNIKIGLYDFIHPVSGVLLAAALLGQRERESSAQTLILTGRLVVVMEVLRLLLRGVRLDPTIGDGLAGTFVSKNWLGYIAGLAVGILLVGSSSGGRRATRTLDLGLMFAGSVLVFLSESKGALASLVVALLAVSVMAKSSRVRRLARLVVSAAMVFGVTIGTVNVYSSLGRDSTLTGRTLLWREVYQLALERPFFGYGTGSVWGWSSEPLRRIYNSLDGRWAPSSAHNLVLDLVLTAGIPISLASTALLLGVLLRVVRGRVVDSSDAIARFISVYFVLMSAGERTFVSAPGGLMLGCVAVLAAGWSKSSARVAPHLSRTSSLRAYGGSQGAHKKDVANGPA